MFLGCLLARTISRAVRSLLSAAGGLLPVLFRKIGRSFPAGPTVGSTQHRSPTSVASLLCLDPLASHDAPGLRDQAILSGPTYK